VKRKALKWLKVTSTSPVSKAVQTRANKIITKLSCFHRKSFKNYVTLKLYGSAWKYLGRYIMTEWERQNTCERIYNNYILNCVFHVREGFYCMEGSLVSFASEKRWRTWSRDVVLFVEL